MRRRRFSTLYVLLLMFLAAACSAPPAPAVAETGDPDAALASLLRHVDGAGWVDYAALKADEDQVRRYASVLAGVTPADYESMDDAARIAFWINAYNGLTLKAIVDHYPIQPGLLTALVYPRNSIRQIPGVWDELQFVVAGEAVTLDHIEHGILRVEFDEPGIHMALVCAAVSCPPLRNEPFRADRLQEQFADQTRTFVSDPNRFRVDLEENIVFLSKIFQWYGSDFIRSYGTPEFGGHSDAERAVLHYLSLQLSPAVAAYLRKGAYEIRYLDYDWSLNERVPGP